MLTCKCIMNDITQEFISSLEKEWLTRILEKSFRLECTKPNLLILLVGLFLYASPVSSKCLEEKLNKIPSKSVIVPVIRRNYP